MDKRPVVWDTSNRKHLIEDHTERRLTVTEIDQVMNDENRVEIYQAEREATLALGRTSAGRGWSLHGLSIRTAAIRSMPARLGAGS